MSMIAHEKRKKAEQEQERKWTTWRVSFQELQEHERTFSKLDTDRDGFIPGAQAKQIFSQTGLPMDVLGKIWSLADRNGDQKLDCKEYTLAMYLINAKQRGETIPSSVPVNLLQSIYTDISEPATDSAAPAAQTQQRNAYGVVTPQEPGPSSPKISKPYDSVPEFSEKLRTSGGNNDSKGSYDAMPTPVLAHRVPLPDSPAPSPRPKSSPYGTPIHTNTDQLNLSGGSISATTSVSSYNSEAQGQDQGDSAPPPPNPRDPPPPPEWVEYKTPEGKAYYFDKTNKITTWAQPEGFDARAPSDSSRGRAPPPPMKETTESLMSDPAKVEFFRDFLESESSNSEILLYMEIENFRQHAPKSGPLTQSDFLKADAIYSKFIKKNAVFPVPLPPKVKSEIKKALKGGKKGLHAEIFSEAQSGIIKLLEQQQLPRFMKSMFYITMYNSMIARAPYELPDLLWKEFEIAAEGTEENGWEYVSEKKGVLIHKKKFEGSEMTCVRGSGVIPIPPDELYVFAVSTPLRFHWENLYSQGRIVERLDSKTVICHHCYKPPKWAKMYKGHEVLLVRTERRGNDGTIMVLNRSVVHKEAQEGKTHVRDELEVSGFVIRPCGATSSVIIYVNQCKMNGIPKWAESRYMNKRPLLLHNIRKFVEKELKDKKKSPAWKNPAMLEEKVGTWITG